MDEHNSSYASSHSSDSEVEKKKRSKPKWNNERSPVHSIPKGTTFMSFIHLALSFPHTQNGKSTVYKGYENEFHHACPIWIFMFL